MSGCCIIYWSECLQEVEDRQLNWAACIICLRPRWCSQDLMQQKSLRSCYRERQNVHSNLKICIALHFGCRLRSRIHVAYESLELSDRFMMICEKNLQPQCFLQDMCWPGPIYVIYVLFYSSIYMWRYSCITAISCCFM